MSDAARYQAIGPEVYDSRTDLFMPGVNDEVFAQFVAFCLNAQDQHMQIAAVRSRFQVSPSMIQERSVHWFELVYDRSGDPRSSEG